MGQAERFCVANVEITGVSKRDSTSRVVHALRFSARTFTARGTVRLRCACMDLGKVYARSFRVQ